MPQLWTETIVTQYFWLVVVLFGFYYLAVTQIIPQIAFTLKTRKELETNSQNINVSTNKNTSSENNTKSLLSNILTPLATSASFPKGTTGESKETVQLKSNINNIKADWIKKYSV